jgi:putative intracellular protease/amidase
MAKVLIPLPARDFDPTEAAVSWKVLSALGHAVVFASPDGTRSFADDLMITGEGLDPWGFVPGLKKLTGWFLSVGALAG